ncbi:MAG: formylglycine-generating enzyme family protein, partial [Acidobacteriales bacterium]|nr:formylglycine-generating enzyme family protein [Terriglobales bacterium]
APDLPAVMEMITGPAAVAGLSFEDGLPGQILRDTGSEPGSLALMAFALSELYNACQPGTMLTRSAYDSFNGVKGAIAKRAEDAYNDEDLDDESRNAFGEVFKELVDVDPERGIPTRKRSALSHFSNSPAASRFIEAFTKARLLSCGNADKADAVVEVAHEALLTHWPRLHGWIKYRIDDFRLLRQVKHEAADWQRLGKPETHLWRHERLEPVQVMLNRLLPTLSETEKEFVRPEAERLVEKLQLYLTHQQREQILPDIIWLPVAGGEITLADNAGTFPVAPSHISKYLVTWMQYRAFLEADDGYRNAAWWRGLAKRQKKPGEQYRQQLNCPADNVSWYDVIAFCRWLSQRLGFEVRLPTEWEWQQAATGGDAEREFPWGPKWDPAFANTSESGLSRSTAVGLYPQGSAPGGASDGPLDMSGNLWEWCLNESNNPERTDVRGDAHRVVRGGAWNLNQDSARAACCLRVPPDLRGFFIGFRVVCSSLI